MMTSQMTVSATDMPARATGFFGFRSGMRSYGLAYASFGPAAKVHAAPNAGFSITLLHWILQLYTLFVVFEGARRFLKVQETKLTSYTVVATVLILLSPALIEFVFNKLSVILN